MSPALPDRVAPVGTANEEGMAVGGDQSIRHRAAAGVKASGIRGIGSGGRIQRPVRSRLLLNPARGAIADGTTPSEGSGSQPECEIGMAWRGAARAGKLGKTSCFGRTENRIARRYGQSSLRDKRQDP